MSVDARPNVAAEWRAHWLLPVSAMIGYSSMGLATYAISPFVPELETAFGWSRAQVMSGISISVMLGIFGNMVIGALVDRFGSRRVAIAGLLVKCGAFALLGVATGSVLNWVGLWLLLGLGILLVQSPVWTGAVAAQFDKSRGLAMAVALSGTSLAAIFAPSLAANLIEQFGWRQAFLVTPAIWLAVALPVVLLFFRGSPGNGGAKARGAAKQPLELPGLSFREALRTRAFWQLFVSYGCFAFFSFTMSVNLVPLLAETGIGMVAAAGVAAIMGLVGIGARIAVGALIDRYSANLIGTVTMLMPAAGSVLLLTMEPSYPVLMTAVALFGAAIGAEIDVVSYLATRHFGLKAFAALMGAIIGIGALTSTIGPVLVGRLHDVYKSYDPLLMIVSGLMCIGAIAVLTMKRPVHDWGNLAH
jgi:MFS family permease